MRKDVGESIIKVGTNVSSLGAAGLIFFEDDMTIVSGMIASVVVVYCRNWRFCS